MKAGLLLIGILWAAAVQAEDFDFGGSAQSADTFLLPIRGSFAAELAGQTGGAARWQRMGIASHLILDANTGWGQFYADGNVRYNSAHRLESDPDFVLSTYEIERILRELYWSRSFGSVTLTVGNRIVVWGKADALVITDVVSPRDMTAFFFAKPTESRLGQNVVMLDYYQNRWQLGVFVIPFPAFNRNTPNGHPYSNTAGLDVDNRIKDRGVEVGIRSQHGFDRGEIAFLAGYFHNRDPLFQDLGHFEETYRRSPMVGATWNHAFDPVLLKSEVSYNHRQPQQAWGGPDGLGVSRVSTFGAMFGMDYNHSRLGVFTLEGLVQAPLERQEHLIFSENWYSVAGGWSDTFANEDLTLSAFFFIFRRFENVLFRLGADYQLNDRWKLTSQWTTIMADPSDPFFSRAAQFDRVDAGLEYHFDLAH